MLYTVLLLYCAVLCCTVCIVGIPDKAEISCQKNETEKAAIKAVKKF